MIGILLMTHGTLGESLLHCASHILGSRPRQLAQIGVTPQDDPQLILPLGVRAEVDCEARRIRLLEPPVI